jgi:hypothetical protein
MNLQGSAILVTSRAEEQALLKTCLQQGIKVLPKSMAAVIPIYFDPGEAQGRE